MARPTNADTDKKFSERFNDFLYGHCTHAFARHPALQSLVAEKRVEFRLELLECEVEHLNAKFRGVESMRSPGAGTLCAEPLTAPTCHAPAMGVSAAAVDACGGPQRRRKRPHQDTAAPNEQLASKPKPAPKRSESASSFTPAPSSPKWLPGQWAVEWHLTSKNRHWNPRVCFRLGDTPLWIKKRVQSMAASVKAECKVGSDHESTDMKVESESEVISRPSPIKAESGSAATQVQCQER